MKIHPISNGHISVLAAKNSAPDEVNKNHSVANKNFELPSFNMMAANMPFKFVSFKSTTAAKSIQELNDKYVKEINDAKAELAVLQNPKDNPAVKKAQEENDFYDDFEKNGSKYYSEAQDAADRAKRSWKNRHNAIYRLFHSGELSDLQDAKFASYNRMNNRYWDIRDRYDLNKNLIESAQQNETARLKRINDLNELIAKNEKLIDYAGLQKTINDMLNGKGGLEERIAGYKQVKSKIRQFVENIKNAKDNPDGYVQPCVILYGATGTGKSTFLHAIESMNLDNVAIIRFNEDQSTPFMDRFRTAMNEAKQRYLNTQQRTILLMDDAEKYFAMSESDAKAHYADELDEDDLERLRTINANGTNRNVKDFKAILDELAMIPTDDEDRNSYKSAMSIFITTNHPNIIDRQLIKRPEKMDAYHVGPAKGEDLIAVVKFYFKDKISVLNQIKMFKDRPDRDAAIDGLSGISLDAKESIKEMFRQGKADIYSIDIDDIDFDALTEDIQPNIEDGAYSNVMIKTIAKNAFSNYLTDPENSFVQHFYDELENTARDIEPQRYAGYLDSAKNVNLYKDRKEKNLDDEYEFVKMLNTNNKGLLKKEAKKNLNSYIQDMRVRKENLDDKKNIGNISETECDELEVLNGLLSYVDAPQKVKEYLRTHKPNNFI